MNSGNLSKYNFENLKSDYFLERIFYNIKKNKFLDIIKYNKNLQNRLNISINDYKEYFILFTPIEIELKIAKGKFGKFINISDKEKDFYHIYFHNSNIEIKSNYLKKDDNDKIIKIIIDSQIKSFEKLFDFCPCVSSINFKKFHRNNMRGMFWDCFSLEELNLSNFNTINVTDMSDMFNGCSSLKKLNLSNFNTINVTNMASMFNGCSSIEEINLSNFNTDNVINMSEMFNGCSSLKELNLSNFNTNKVTNMSCMFNRCTSIEEINLFNFNTDNVIYMSRMFNECSSLKKINASNIRIHGMNKRLNEDSSKLTEKINLSNEKNKYRRFFYFFIFAITLKFLYEKI